MKLGINAFNIRQGGGVTHLVELLSASTPEEHGITEVMLWGGPELLAKIPERKWLKKKSLVSIEKNWFYKIYWMLFSFPKEVVRCDILFIPGGSYFGRFHPYVTMLQNMLPFEPE